jgi:hypothetical protein
MADDTLGFLNRLLGTVVGSLRAQPIEPRPFAEFWEQQRELVTRIAEPSGQNHRVVTLDALVSLQDREHYVAISDVLSNALSGRLPSGTEPIEAGMTLSAVSMDAADSKSFPLDLVAPLRPCGTRRRIGAAQGGFEFTVLDVAPVKPSIAGTRTPCTVASLLSLRRGRGRDRSSGTYPGEAQPIVPPYREAQSEVRRQPATRASHGHPPLRRDEFAVSQSPLWTRRAICRDGTPTRHPHFRAAAAASGRTVERRRDDICGRRGVSVHSPHVLSTGAGALVHHPCAETRAASRSNR